MASTMEIRHLKKSTLLSAGLLFFMLLSLTSCTTTALAEPSENPIYLTSDGQTKDTWVDNLSGIAPENPETDFFEFSNYGTFWSKVANDWITMYEGEGLPRGVVRITVKENTSPNPRSYVLTLQSKIYTTTLTIMQAGKS